MKLITDYIQEIKNNLITELNLKHNTLSIIEIKQLVKEFVKAFEHNTSIVSLNLADINLESDEAKCVAKLLEKNNLISLNLADNSIKDIGVKYIADALVHNTSLLSLNLSFNDIRSKGAEYLAKALETNTSLKTLNLYGNHIDCEHLAKALETNTNLLSLNMGYNIIGSIVVTHFANALEQNTSLIFLDLSLSGVLYNKDFDMFDIIDKKLVRNKRLRIMKSNATKIHLGFGNNIPYFIKQKLIFDDNLTETENLKWSDKFLHNLVI